MTALLKIDTVFIQSSKPFGDIEAPRPPPEPAEGDPEVFRRVRHVSRRFFSPEDFLNQQSALHGYDAYVIPPPQDPDIYTLRFEQAEKKRRRIIVISVVAVACLVLGGCAIGLGLHYS
jgi:hypothetical protein